MVVSLGSATVRRLPQRRQKFESSLLSKLQVGQSGISRLPGCVLVLPTRFGGRDRLLVSGELAANLLFDGLDDRRFLEHVAAGRLVEMRQDVVVFQDIVDMAAAPT